MDFGDGGAREAARESGAWGEGERALAAPSSRSGDL